MGTRPIHSRPIRGYFDLPKSVRAHGVSTMLRVQGFPVAVVAVCWMVFSVVMLAFPTAPGPTANEMNYMIVVFGGWIALCLAYYYFPVYGGVQW